MQTAPSIPAIISYLEKRGYDKQNFKVVDIDPKPWSGHFNFLVEAGDKKFVLRFKGPEWGEPTQGVIDEYNILKYVESHNVAPKAFYLEKDFFGEPMILEEYLEGKLLNSFPDNEQRKMFSSVARLIAEINSIPAGNPDDYSFFHQPRISYERHKKVWRERLSVALKNSIMHDWAEKISRLLPKAAAMLDSFEPQLQKVIRENKQSVFIFESAHLGHCISTSNGLKFLNWEKVSYGDPSYTLAVFLSSLKNYPDFLEIKKEMMKVYLEKRPVPDFETLLGQRLAEREVSNLTWVLWAYVQRHKINPLKQIPDITERFERVKEMLKVYRVESSLITDH